MLRKTLLTLVLSSAVLASAGASALTAQQTVYKEVSAVQNGVTTVSRVPAELVVPGETVVYALSYTNDADAPAADIVLTMPVPEAVSYIEGSAERENTDVTFSADAGATFAPRGDVTLIDADGRVQKAPASSITHIRWRVTTALPVGATDELAFRATLK